MLSLATGLSQTTVVVLVFISKSRCEVGVAGIHSWKQAYFAQLQTSFSAEKDLRDAEP